MVLKIYIYNSSVTGKLEKEIAGRETKRRRFSVYKF